MERIVHTVHTGYDLSLNEELSAESAVGEHISVACYKGHENRSDFRLGLRRPEPQFNHCACLVPARQLRFVRSSFLAEQTLHSVLAHTESQQRNTCQYDTNSMHEAYCMD